MSSFFQNLSAAFASFNSSPHRPRSDDPQRPLDQHRRSSIAQHRVHSRSLHNPSPPSPAAGSRWHRERARNEFSLDLEDEDRHRFNLRFESSHDSAAPQVRTSLPKLPSLNISPTSARHLLSFTSRAMIYCLEHTLIREESRPPLNFFPAALFFLSLFLPTLIVLPDHSELCQQFRPHAWTCPLSWIFAAFAPAFCH